jgi:tetraacyldisaccharide 4'-kinase
MIEQVDRTADRTGKDPRCGSAWARRCVQRLWEGRPASRAGPGRVPDAGGAGYRSAVMRARNVAYGSGLAGTDSPPVPAISVGNITVGGTGKTPMVRWVVRSSCERGWTPGILHGGYADGRAGPPPHVVPGPSRGGREGPAAGAGRPCSMGADVLVLDDAFQHRRLGRDLDIVLVAAETWTRHARLLPRGPYREPPRACAAADDRGGDAADDARAEDAARVEVEVARISGRRTARVHLGPGHWVDSGAMAPPGRGRPEGPAIAVAGIGAAGRLLRSGGGVGRGPGGRHRVPRPPLLLAGWRRGSSMRLADGGPS